MLKTKVVTMLSEEQVVQASLESIKEGLYYSVPKRTQKYYAHSPYVVTGAGEMRAGMPCYGVVAEQFDQNIVREALLEYIAFVQDFVHSALARSIVRYMPSDKRNTLGISDDLDLRGMILPQSLARIDVLSHCGRPWICDPNFMPIGMAHHAYYARRFGNKQHIAHIKKLANLPGTNGIISTLQHGNALSHEYLARLVRDYGGDFHLFPLETWDASQTYNTIIRHVREKFDFSNMSQMINPYGIGTYESFVWLAVAQMLNIKAVQELFIPTILCRIDDDDSIYVAIEINDGGTDVIWQEFSDAKPILTQALQAVGQCGAGKKCWVIKAVHSSGAKGVRMTAKVGFSGSIAGLERDLRKKCTGMKIFTLSPFIPSLAEIHGEVRRLKWDLFYSGIDMTPAGTHILTTPTNQQLVHGGAGTAMWISQ